MSIYAQDGVVEAAPASMGKSMSAGPLSDAAPSGTIADQLGTSQYAVDAPGAGGPSPVAQIVAAVQGASDDDKKKACGALVFVSLVVLVISTSGNTPTRKKASSNYVPGGACMTTGANFAGVKSQCRFPFSVVLTSGANAGKLKTYTECTADAYAFGSGIVDGKRPACYTQIDSRGHGMPGQVDYCGAAPRCTAKIFSECYEKSTGLDYRGAKAVSKTSGACLSWTNQVKANGKNGFSVLSQGAKQRGIGNHNYCRATDTTGVWCYLKTVNAKGRRWDYCDVGKPKPTCDPGGKCRRGYFATSASKPPKSCATCPKNTYSDIVGVVSTDGTAPQDCKRCAGGTVSDPGSRSCRVPVALQLFHADGECLPNGAKNEVNLGHSDSVQHCATKCKEHAAKMGNTCNYFIFGKKNGYGSRVGLCWRENVDCADTSSGGGFTNGPYDVYRVVEGNVKMGLCPAGHYFDSSMIECKTCGKNSVGLALYNPNSGMNMKQTGNAAAGVKGCIQCQWDSGVPSSGTQYVPIGGALGPTKCGCPTGSYLVSDQNGASCQSCGTAADGSALVSQPGATSCTQLTKLARPGMTGIAAGANPDNGGGAFHSGGMCKQAKDATWKEVAGGNARKYKTNLGWSKPFDVNVLGGLATQLNVDACAKKCIKAAAKVQKNCNFFIVGTGWKLGRCWWEHTGTGYGTGCVKFVKDNYDVYKIAV